MNKHFKSYDIREGYEKIVDNTNSELKYIEMGKLNFENIGSVYEGDTEDRELGINILTGVMALSVEIKSGGNYDFNEIGNRMNIFSGPPAMVYIPINARYRMKILKPPFSAAMYFAPSSIENEPIVVMPNQIETIKTGKLNWTRFVRKGIADNVNAHRLIMGETLTPSGNWTSYPPHKHDEYKPPIERPAEEVYSFYFDNSDGFAIIRLYTPKDDADPFDETYVVNDNDVITISKGYHPIAVAPGYKCCYLFCLAGEERIYGAWSDDKAHSWIRGCETIMQGNDLE